jgi:hypothetical protein
MPPTITAQQRNLLYEDILDRLSGIDDVRLAVCQEDYERAQRLGVAFSDDLRLVSEDLGWGEDGPGGTIELKTPPDILRRALGRMRDWALRIDASEEKERSELRESEERNHLVVEACRQVLTELDGTGANSEAKRFTDQQEAQGDARKEGGLERE